MISDYNASTIEELLAGIEVPSSAYEKAEARYKDLGGWFEREESLCSNCSPHIYPQGSFRLGTVIRPVGDKGDYDLDLGCRLREGISKATHSQKDLKDLVGKDLESYRKARNIQSPLDEKHRCWRLQYADELSFHMDVVPSIPEEQERRGMLKQAMVTEGMNESLADSVSKDSGAITDDRHPAYSVLSPDWRISDSGGYATWFESRMRLAQIMLEKRAEARLDDLPARRWGSPLQNVVKLLKWHRDMMFESNPDSKPISIIITTLAAHAYAGEDQIEIALANVLNRMGGFVREDEPRVPNPINPSEDFADKWANADYAHLELEKSFWDWLEKAKADFDTVSTTSDRVLLEKTAREAFGMELPRRLTELEEAQRNLTSLNKSAASSQSIESAFDVPWKKAPPWDFDPQQYPVTLTGKWCISENGPRWTEFESNGSPLGKHLYLRFRGRSDAPTPYRVYWQVVNTGIEALRVGQGRGEIVPSRTIGAGGLYSTTAEGALRNERTLYAGSHSIECFVVKGGICVGRSGPFVVNIS